MTQTRNLGGQKKKELSTATFRQRSSSSKRASTSGYKVTAAAGSEDDDFVPAQDSSRFRQKQMATEDDEKPSGLLGNLVSNLPTLAQRRRSGLLRQPTGIEDVDRRQI